MKLSEDFPPLSASNSKKAKRQENKAKKLHAYYELIKDKQPTSFEDNKLPKPSSSSEVKIGLYELLMEVELLW